MNITIFSATGPSGRLIVEQALEQRHAVTAFVLNPAALSIQNEKLTVVKGDVLDLASVEAAIAGKDAVLSALGVRKLGKNTNLSDGTKNIITAMKKHGVKRFVHDFIGRGRQQGPTGMDFQICNQARVPAEHLRR
jgi:putative NADH-flavin reductase